MPIIPDTNTDPCYRYHQSESPGSPGLVKDAEPFLIYYDSATAIYDLDTARDHPSTVRDQAGQGPTLQDFFLATKL